VNLPIDRFNLPREVVIVDQGGAYFAGPRVWSSRPERARILSSGAAVRLIEQDPFDFSGCRLVSAGSLSGAA